ncbi:MAG: hypothetical protein ABH828_01755 [archaeon]
MIKDKNQIKEFKTYLTKPVTGVFGSSKTVIQSEKAKDFAIELGRTIPYNILTGGSTGLPLYTANYATLTDPSRLIVAVSPFATWEQHTKFFTRYSQTDQENFEIGMMKFAFSEWIFLDVAKNHPVKRAFLERNHYNVGISDIACILPGTEGTLDELKLSILNNRPLAVATGLNTKFEDKVGEMIDKSQYKNVVYCKDPIDISNLIESYNAEN